MLAKTRSLGPLANTSGIERHAKWRLDTCKAQHCCRNGPKSIPHYQTSGNWRHEQCFAVYAFQTPYYPRQGSNAVIYRQKCALQTHSMLAKLATLEVSCSTYDIFSSSDTCQQHCSTDMAVYRLEFAETTSCLMSAFRKDDTGHGS